MDAKSAASINNFFAGIRRTKEAVKRLEDIQRIREQIDLAQKINDDIEQARFHLPVAKITSKRYQRHIVEYVDIVTAQYEISAAECFYKDKVIEYTQAYFTLLVYQGAKGKIDEKFKAMSLYERQTSLTHWFVLNTPGFASIYMEWHHTLKTHIHYLAVKYTLGTGKREKNYYGLEELTILIETAMSDIDSVKMMKQSIVLWQMALLTGVRPGSIGPADSEDDYCLRWKDIRMMIGNDGELEVIVLFGRLKGHDDPYQRKKSRTALLYTDGLPVRFTKRKKGVHIIADVTITIPLLAIERGYLKFKNYQEILDYLKNPKSPIELPVNSDLKDHPVFLGGKANNVSDLSDKPMLAKQLHVSMQRVALIAGLGGRPPTLYSFRRETLTHLIREYGEDAAREMAAHKRGGDAIEAYNQGISGLDVSEARLAFGKDQKEDRNLNRRLLTAPYINSYEPGTRNSVEAAAREFVWKDSEYRILEDKLQDYVGVLRNKYDMVISAKTVLDAFTELTVNEKEKLAGLLRERKNLRRRLLKRGRLRYMAEAQDRIKATLTAEERSKRIEKFGRIATVISEVPAIRIEESEIQESSEMRDLRETMEEIDLEERENESNTENDADDILGDEVEGLLEDVYELRTAKNILISLFRPKINSLLKK
ncbi:hypothetical protein TWF694_009924 [Orbilia ellipsospora]|uniref:Uncharacterized protein n=1 Tax=Orbilia ellipsospora TaxID=2528407 RepID=A0AAV9XCA8_9PEZI